MPTRPTIHRVTPVVDGGSIVYQREVPILDGDTAESLAERVLPVEHQMMITFLKQLAEGDVKEISPVPIVLPSEEELLQEAIRYGREQYPDG